MPGKRLRLVRSKASFDDLSALNQPLQPPPLMRMNMKPPRPQSPLTAPMEEDDFVLYQPQTLTLRPDVKKVNDQGHIGSFLDRCNYCRKVLGEKDNIYMYSSLRAFCSSQCRQRQIIMDNVEERVASGQSTTTEIMSWLRKMNSLIR